MRRVIGMVRLVALAGLVAFAVCSCNGGVGDVIATEDDSGETMTLQMGQALVVQLKSNPSTGYNWEVTDLPSVLEQQGEEIYEQDPGTEGVIGAGGTENFRFLAVEEGSGELRLHYVRPWEDSAVIAEEFVLEVVVR